MRFWWMLGATGAALLAVVFGTVGDGVRVVVHGWQRFIWKIGHWLTWALLALGLGLAAVLADWTPVSQALCVAAGLVYLAFLVVVVTGSGQARRLRRQGAEPGDERQ